GRLLPGAERPPARAPAPGIARELPGDHVRDRDSGDVAAARLVDPVCDAQPVGLTPSGGVRTLLSNTCSPPSSTPEREMQTTAELTGRQREIWSFLVAYVDRHGYPPTVREIGEAVGLASPSTVHAHLANLERAGLLRRDPTKPRALELVGREKS